MSLFSQQDDALEPLALDAVLLSNYAYPTTDDTTVSKQRLEDDGWRNISADELGYTGSQSENGAFNGELFGYESAQVQVMGKYSDAGELQNIGLSFRGTDSISEVDLGDFLGDIGSDLSTLLPGDVWEEYAPKAFGELFSRVANYAQENGLSGQDVLVTGHSLGGMAVNSMAASSDDTWDGFYSDAHYLAYASPTENSKVFNFGYENDPVYHVLPNNNITLPDSLTPTSYLGNHTTAEYGTNNIVNFDDYYAGENGSAFNESIANFDAWDAHSILEYENGVERILSSEFYTQIEQNSTLVVSNLSDSKRQDSWVEDRNTAHEEREGPTFLLGSSGDDLLKGNDGNDYLEGFSGNDTFAPGGCYNIVAGGDGDNSLYLDGSLVDYQTVFHNDILYVKDSDGGITQAQGVNAVSADEHYGFFNLGTEHVDYSRGDTGFVSSNPSHTDFSYASSKSVEDAGGILTLDDEQWGFGSSHDDIITTGLAGGETIVGGGGNDIINSQGGDNDFLFNGDFGSAVIHDFDQTDQLIFTGLKDILGKDFSDFATQVNDNVDVTFGDNNVELVGVSLNELNNDQFVLA